MSDEEVAATEEYEQWVPVTESGDRWNPRSKALAEEDLRIWPAGVNYADGYPGDGITHLEYRKVRVFYGPWRRAR